ncbi:hypothetical protein GQS_07775 [Thermococcus sp. 4557]|uniref:hypothetical protein n=1 Tax=Thermococcus sp. (strain CGMCC 1.5172 / 4557) TaxID=1042877 RepID=UPI000219EC9C|nr:hypothetical protein [Thermococcus sp. 4557]AEK73451.1 hypothetical protein GQS_07775 [Thermococcus sp. 4557]
MEEFGEWFGGSSRSPEVVLLFKDGGEMKFQPAEVSVYEYVTFMTYKDTTLELHHSENINPQEIIDATDPSRVERIIMRVEGRGKRLVLLSLLIEPREVRPVNSPLVEGPGATLVLPTPLGLLEVYSDSCDELEIYIDGRFLKAEEVRRVLNTLRDEYDIDVCRILEEISRAGLSFLFGG